MDFMKRIPWEWVIPILLGIGIIPVVAFAPYQVSLVVAALAATFAGVSAMVSTRALQQTRKTQRPFLNVSYIAQLWNENEKPISLNAFEIHVSNRGVFPGDEVTIACNVVMEEDGTSRTVALKPSHEIATICFPGDSFSNLIFKAVDDTVTLKHDKDVVDVRIEICYKNKLTNEQHKTVRNYKAYAHPSGHPVPCPEKDDW